MFSDNVMHVFYVDESGCTGALPAANSPVQPLICIGGLILDSSSLERLTLEWLCLKERFYPGLRTPDMEFLDMINVEIKGADLRRHIREGGRNIRRHAMGFLEKSLELLEAHHARLIARVYVKAIGAPMDGRAVYTSAIQQLAGGFQSYLTGQQSSGMMILDSRNKPKNSNVAHSTFTQMFKPGGNAYSRMVEMPVFGHSDNHAGLQLADLLCSGFLFPMAAHAYCQGIVTNMHVHANYDRIRDKFGPRLQALQYRYKDRIGSWRGGVTVSDPLGRRSSKLIFGT